MVISDIGFAHCHTDHTTFVRRTRSGSVTLVVYVDDILLIGSDSVTLAETRVTQTIFCDEGYGEAKIFPWD